MPIFNRDKRTEYHTITCDHPLMIDVGMSSFTLPQFVEWWYFQDANGKYINQNLFPDAHIYDLATLLGYNRDYGNQYCINAWRFEDYNFGAYQKYTIHPDLIGPDTDGWQYYNNNPDAPQEDVDTFELDILDLKSLDGKTFNRISRDYEDYNLGNRQQISLGVYSANLIALNDKYNIMGYDDEEEQDRAARQLFKDIRRSKNAGYVSWTNDVAINLTLVQGAEPCVRTEEFTFKLYLHSKKRPANTSKSQAMQSINIAAPAIGPDGINNKGKVDGESNAVADDSPNNKIGGTLATTYRSYDGRFSAGSEEIFGIVASETIPAAKWMDNPEDWATNLDIEENFTNIDQTQYLTPGTGEIYPLDLQNGNPFQWAPNYANPSGCRGDNKEKVKLKVFNMSTKDFSKGDAVVATDRHSLWFIDPLASSVVSPIVTRKQVRGWQFMYFMTNEPHYLRFADAHQESNPQGLRDLRTHNNTNARHRDAEKALSRKYLKTFLGQEGYENWFNSLTLEEKDAGTAWKGYAQVTSWDFMAPEFAGLREKRGSSPSPDEKLGNALVLTNHGMGHDGDTSDFLQKYNSYGTVGRGRFTAPFFGCTFPDGYQEQEKYSLYNGKPYHENEGERVLSGSGWRPNGFNEEYNVTQNDSFFNLSSFHEPLSELDSEGFESGIFDPFAPHNNKSTNISPFYFLDSDQKDPVSGVKHCNLFSSGPDLFHLPADIATNGSWSASHGGPIMSLYKVQEYITNPTAYDQSEGKGINWSQAESIHNSFHDFWLDSGSFQWLWNTVDPDSKSGINDPENSLLDFSPANPNRVEFRPARDGLFAQFDPPQPGTAGHEISHPSKYLMDQGFQNFSSFGGSISHLGSNKYGDSEWGGNEPLWGYKTKERLLHNDTEGDYGCFINVSSPDGYPDPELGDGKVMPFRYEIYDEYNEFIVGTTSNFHAPISAYCNSPRVGHALFGSSHGDKSRGAFGVIGAIATTQVTDEGIEFTTESFIGQPFYTAGAGGVFLASAGGRGLSYYSPNSTALYVKIYESWPRDQLIYDPRFFAVHHFNEGNRLPIGRSDSGLTKRPWELHYTLGPNVEYQASGEPQIPFASGSQVISHVNVRHQKVEGEQVVSAISGIPFAVDKAITNVDMRIPSFYNGVSKTGIAEVTALAEKDHNVFKEGVIPFDNNFDLTLYGEQIWMPDSDTVEILDNLFDSETEEYQERQDFLNKRAKYMPLANPDHWKINPDRRGRMLPWIYRERVIGPATPKIIDLSDISPEDTLYKITHQDKKGSIIVRSSGQDYEIGQQFTVQGGNGAGVLLKISATGEVGNPTGFNFVEDRGTIYDETFGSFKHGEGYLPEDFLEGETSGIDNRTKGKLEIVAVSGSNRTFRGSFVYGETYIKRQLDRKPRIATTEKGPYRLSIGDNTLQETGAPTWRDTMDIEIIPMGQGVILGDGTSTIGFPGLEKTDPMGGYTTVQIVISLDGEGNKNVVANDYDMFFYCVNDMSHTWIESDGLPLTVENYITTHVKAY